MFPTEDAAEQWWIQQRWPDGVICVRCESKNIQKRPTRKPQPYRCRDCRKDFSVKTGTLLHNSKLTLQQWAFAMYQMSTSLKGASSMKLHRDLEITQKSAWHVGHRIREMWNTAHRVPSPVEIDETYVGGKEANKHASEKLRAGRGAIGKEVVVGMKSRNTRHVVANVVPTASAGMIRQLVKKHCEPQSQIYTDQNPSYAGLNERGYRVESVNHSVKEYVRDRAHTNGIESFWAMLKRGYHGTYHKMSPKHLQRYVNEFSGRHNARPMDTSAQLSKLVAGMEGKRLPYQTLIRGKSFYLDTL